MRQHFAVFLGVFRGKFWLGRVDKRSGLAQHVAIGMLQSGIGLMLIEPANENPEQTGDWLSS